VRSTSVSAGSPPSRGVRTETRRKKLQSVQIDGACPEEVEAPLTNIMASL